MSNGNSYRPSSGTEGDAFMGHWCAHCIYGGFDDDEEPCSIRRDAMFFVVEDDEFPDEWVYSGTVPMCTAFLHKLGEDGEAPAVRCDKTLDMFHTNLERT